MGVVVMDDMDKLPTTVDILDRSAVPVPRRGAILFTVEGPPVPWQRVTKGGHVPAKTRAYKKLVAWKGTEARLRDHSWGWKDHSAFAVSLEVYRLPAKGKQRRGDCDNIAKSVLDALSGVLYRDDCQVRRLVVELYDCAPGRERLVVGVERYAVQVKP